MRVPFTVTIATPPIGVMSTIVSGTTNRLSMSSLTAALCVLRGSLARALGIALSDARLSVSAGFSGQAPTALTSDCAVVLAAIHGARANGTLRELQGGAGCPPAPSPGATCAAAVISTGMTSRVDASNSSISDLPLVLLLPPAANAAPVFSLACSSASGTVAAADPLTEYMSASGGVSIRLSTPSGVCTSTSISDMLLLDPTSPPASVLTPVTSGGTVPVASGVPILMLVGGIVAGAVVVTVILIAIVFHRARVHYACAFLDYRAARSRFDVECAAGDGAALRKRAPQAPSFASIMHAEARILLCCTARGDNERVHGKPQATMQHAHAALVMGGRLNVNPLNTAAATLGSKSSGRHSMRQLLDDTSLAHSSGADMIRLSANGAPSLSLENPLLNRPSSSALSRSPAAPHGRANVSPVTSADDGSSAAGGGRRVGFAAGSTRRLTGMPHSMRTVPRSMDVELE